MSYISAKLYNKKIVQGGIAILSDLLVIAKKEFDGDTLENSGNRTTTGVLCEFDIPNNKDFYLAYANSWVTDTDDTLNNAQVELQEDITATDTTVGEPKVICYFDGGAGAESQAVPSSMDLFAEFKGKKFTNTSGSAKKIKIRVTSIASSATVRGTIRGWTEDNGTDPSDDFK